MSTQTTINDMKQQKWTSKKAGNKSTVRQMSGVIHTHTHIYARTHAHMRARTYAHTHMRARTHTLTHTHTHTHTHTYTLLVTSHINQHFSHHLKNHLFIYSSAHVYTQRLQSGWYTFQCITYSFCLMFVLCKLNTKEFQISQNASFCCLHIYMFAWLLDDYRGAIFNCDCSHTALQVAYYFLSQLPKPYLQISFPHLIRL